jgi:hypothetical protein
MMMKPIPLLLLIIAAPVQAETITITAAEYGAEWPFTVNEGTLMCLPPGAVILKTRQGMYNINGLAMSHYERNKDIREIWKPDPKIPGMKIYLGDITNRGLKLCK